MRRVCAKKLLVLSKRRSKTNLFISFISVALVFVFMEFGISNNSSNLFGSREARGKGAVYAGRHKQEDPKLSIRMEAAFHSALDCPRNLSLDFMGLGSSTVDLQLDPACTWVKAVVRNVEGNFVALGGEMAVLGNVTLNPQRFKGSQGGESIRDVFRQTEESELPRLLPGFFTLPCRSPPSGVSFHVHHRNYRRFNHLNGWLHSIQCRHPPGSQPQSQDADEGEALGRVGRTPGTESDWGRDVAVASGTESDWGRDVAVASGTESDLGRDVAVASGTESDWGRDVAVASGTESDWGRDVAVASGTESDWGRSQEGTDDDDDYVPGVTLAVQRYEYANVYHATLDWYNAFLALLVLGLDPRAVTLLLVDGHPLGHLDDAWGALFGGRGVMRAGRLRRKTRFQRMVWVPNEYHCPLFHTDRPAVPFLPQLRDYVFNSHNVSVASRVDCGRLRLLLVRRHDYLAHPRNPSGHVQRKIANEDEIVTTLRAAFPQHQTRAEQLDLLTTRQQLLLVSETDILLGMHGAGLTFTLLLPRGAGLVELYPKYYRESKLFKKLCEWRGLQHVSWFNTDSANEKANDYTYIPPPAVVHLVTTIQGQMCPST